MSDDSGKELNLLPESERRSADDAVKRALAKKQERDITLTQPNAAKPMQPVVGHPSWLNRIRHHQKQAKPKPFTEAKPTNDLRFQKMESVKVRSSLFADVKPVAPKKEVPPPPKHISLLSPLIEKRKPQSPVPVEEKPKPKEPIRLEKRIPPPEKPKEKEKPKADLHQPETAKKQEGDVPAPSVNLVPAELRTPEQTNIWVLSLVVFLVVCGVWVGISGWVIASTKRAQANKVELEAKLVRLNVAIKNFEGNKDAAKTLQKQFELVDGVVDSHVYWTPFLQKLADNTIPDVYYATISSSKDGHIQLRAIAKTYAAAARQIRSFERATDFVKTVEIYQATQVPQPGARLPVPVVAFDIKLQLVEGTLSFPETPAEVSLPS